MAGAAQRDRAGCYTRGGLSGPSDHHRGQPICRDPGGGTFRSRWRSARSTRARRRRSSATSRTSRARRAAGLLQHRAPGPQRSSRSDCHAGDATQAARGLPRTFLRRRRRPRFPMELTTSTNTVARPATSETGQARSCCKSRPAGRQPDGNQFFQCRVGSKAAGTATRARPRRIAHICIGQSDQYVCRAHAERCRHSGARHGATDPNPSRKHRPRDRGGFCSPCARTCRRPIRQPDGFFNSRRVRLATMAAHYAVP